MPGTLLLADLERNNSAELNDHLQSLFTPDVTQAPPPVQPTVQIAPPEPQQPPDELQAHLDSLLTPDATQAAPVAPAPAPEPPPPTPPEPAPTNVVDELASHVENLTGGGLRLLGQGMNALGQGAQGGAQAIGQGLTSLREPPARQAVVPAPGPGTPPPPLGPGPSGPFQDYARQAAARAGIDPDIFVRQIQQESGFNPTAGSPAGARGIAQFMPETARGMGVDVTDPYSSLDGAARLMASNLKRYGGDYAKALAAYNAGAGAVDRFGGVPPFEETQRYVDTILSGKQPGPRPETAAAQALGQTGGWAAQAERGRDVSQFGDNQLTADEATAACGPAAAVRFAQRFGRNPTLREATDLAKTVGWTSAQGMAGLSSEKALMDRMGVATKLVSGADWGTFANEARTGNPVTISTQGHYFTADGWDPATNKFHVGRSGLDLRGGSEWMTPEQMTSIMGAVQGGLLADNPTVPASTVGKTEGFTAPGGVMQAASTGLQSLGEGLSSLGEQAGQGLRSLDQAVQTVGGAARDALTGAGQVMQQGQDVNVAGDVAASAAVGEAPGLSEADRAARRQALETSPVGQAYGSDLRKELAPNITEPNHPINVMTDLQEKYRDPTDPTGLRLTERMTPVDRQKYEGAMLAIGGTASPITNEARAAGSVLERAGNKIDYDALAQLRRESRAAQPGLPDMPNATESRLNREIAASVNNMFAIPSMVTNAIGGGIETIKRPVVTAVTGDLGAAGADLRAMGLGLGDAFADMGTTFRTGIRPSRAPSTEVVGQAAYEGQDVLKSGAARIGFLRAMEATDEFMRSLNSAGAQASEIARLMKAHPELSQQELISRFGSNLLDAGEKAAAESVYAVGGTGIGRQMSQWRSLLTAPDATPAQRAAGLVTNVLVPFSNIPDVILTKGLQRLPGMNALTMVRQLRSAEPGVRQRALTSAALAEAVNVGIGVQVMEGNITGNGPSDPAKKAALQNARDAEGNPIWQPNSVRIGGRWLPYASLGPVGLRMGAIANAVEQISDEVSKPNPSEDNLQRIQGTALALLDGTSETVADAWYLQTIGRLFNAMKNGGVGPALGQTALSTAQRALPYGGELRSIEGAVDPTVAEPRNPLDAIAAGIPFASRFATPKIDPTTGRPLERPADVGTLLTRSPGTGEPTPVDTALATHNMGVPDAPKTITQRNFTVSITPDEQRQYTIEAGQRVEKNVQALLDNPRWSSQTPEQQKQALQQAIGAARADAAALVWRSISPKDLDDRVKATQARQAQEAEPVFRAPVTTP